MARLWKNLLLVWSPDVMIDRESLKTILTNVALGMGVKSAPGLEADGDPVDAEIAAVLRGDESPSDTARAIGDVLRAREVDRHLVNECYRASFYLGSQWRDLADNDLYTRFLANKGGQPFDKWVHYFPIYTRHLAPYVGKEIKLLEIGVFHGGGLDLLADLLGPQATLVGVDISVSSKAACAGRFEVAVGDQSDPDFLREVEAEYGPFDVIIDDGGHSMKQQIVSIETLFPGLREGGLYLVEDTHTSYWEPYQDYSTSFIEWAKHKVDDVNGYHHSRELDPGDWVRSVSGVHFYDSVVVLDKHGRFPPFAEVVGSASFILEDRLNQLELLQFKAAADERAAEVAAEREAIRREQLEMQQGMAAISHELAQAQARIQAMEQSRSWRFTSALRGKSPDEDHA